MYKTRFRHFSAASSQELTQLFITTLQCPNQVSAETIRAVTFNISNWEVRLQRIGIHLDAKRRNGKFQL